jgi:hypothetical protein
MAEGIDLSAFDKPAAPTVDLSHFDKPAAVDISHFDSPQQAQQSFPVGQGKVMPVETQVWNEVKDAVPDTVKEMASVAGQTVMNSPVGSVLKVLNKPMEGAAAALTYGLDKTIAPGIQKALNPKGNFFPDIAYHDVINYIAPSNDDAQKYLESLGLSPDSVRAGRLTYAAGKTGVGLAADLFADPLMYVGIGELTAAGKAEHIAQANKIAEGTLDASKAVKPERYALSYGFDVPFTDKSLKVGVKADTVSSAIKAVPGGKAALSGASKVVDGAANILKRLDYHTDIPEVDAAMSGHANTVRGDQQYIFDNFVTPMNEYKFTPGERRVLAAAIEGTKNEAVHADVLVAAKEHAERLNVKVPDARLDQIAEAGIKIKAENALDLEERAKAGVYNPNQDNTIENYLVHKMSPQARAWLDKNPEKAAAIQESLLKHQADRAIKDSVLSTYDSAKNAREIKGPLETANQIMKEKTGVRSWFIEDPIVSTAMKRAETRRLVRDSELIQRIEKYGTTQDVARANRLQWKEIKIPQYEGALPSKNVVFPPKIADAVGYYIAPRQTGNFTSFLDSYHRVYRNFALFSPSYYLRNINENLFKNWVQGVKMSDYLDTAKVALGKGSIEVGGKTFPASVIKEQMAKLGITSSNQYREGVKSLMDVGRKLESDRRFINAAGSVKTSFQKGINILKEGGEYGENSTRRALFINRIKQGYSPAAAALEVEKYLFDYNRTSKGMDVVRRFWSPFFQHAYKTMLITPEMLSKAPGKYNFLHNNMMEAIQAGMQDPVTAAEVKTIIPRYEQIHDPIVGPILTGNSWLKRIFTNQTAVDREGKLGVAVLFKNDIGLSILNQFALFNDEMGKSAGLVSPLMKSVAVLATGRDPFTLKVIDPTTQSADMARRFNYAMNAAIEGATPVPNAWKFVKQGLGIGDPKYYTPNAVLLLHAALGKFVTVTDLDREYSFRMMAMQMAQKELQKNLISQARKEVSGRTADAWLSDKPLLKTIKDAINYTESSSYLYNKMLKNQVAGVAMNSAASGLAGELSAAEIASHLKDLNKHIETQAKQYEAIQAYRLEQLKNAPAAEVRAMAPGSNPRPDRSPQSIGPGGPGGPGRAGDYVDPSDFMDNINEIMNDKSISHDERLDKLADEAENIQSADGGSGEMSEEEKDRLSSFIGDKMEQVESLRDKSDEEKKIIEKNRKYLEPDVGRRTDRRDEQPAVEGDEDKLMRAPRKSDAEELALRSQLGAVQRTNRDPRQRR